MLMQDLPKMLHCNTCMNVIFHMQKNPLVTESLFLLGFFVEKVNNSQNVTIDCRQKFWFILCDLIFHSWGRVLIDTVFLPKTKIPDNPDPENRSA